MKAYTRWERTAQVLIVLVVGLLMLAGVASASTGSAGRRPPMPATIFTAGTAADAMRQAVVYLDETGSDPASVTVTGPSAAQDVLWTVVIVE